jgi:hypothetical protein
MQSLYGVVNGTANTATGAKTGSFALLAGSDSLLPPAERSEAVGMPGHSGATLPAPWPPDRP